MSTVVGAINHAHRGRRREQLREGLDHIAVGEKGRELGELAARGLAEPVTFFEQEREDVAHRLGCRLDDERRVREVVLEALTGHGQAGRLAQALWRQSDMIRVRREMPVWTDRGKLMPVRLLRKA